MSATTGRGLVSRQIEIRDLLDSRPLVITALFVVIAAVISARSSSALAYPVLHCEDGTIMLAHYFNNQNPLEIFRFYEGYVSLFPNLVGYLSVLIFPVHIVPYIFAIISVFIAAFTLSVFSSRRFDFIIEDDLSRWMICLILALIPFGNFSLDTNLTYSFWHLFLAAVIMIIAPLPRSTSGVVFQSIFLFFALCSHPLSIILVPICAVLLFVRPTLRDRISNASIILVTVIYVLIGTQTTGEVGARVLSSAAVTVKYLVHRVVFESTFGNSLRDVLTVADQDIVIVSFAACSVLMFISLNILLSHKVQGKLSKIPWLLVTAIYVIVMLTLSSVYGRSMDVESHMGRWAQRYFFIQQILWIFVTIIMTVKLISWQKMLRSLKFVLPIFVAVYLGYLNYSNAEFFHTSINRGVGTMTFLREVSAELRKPAGERVQGPMVYERPGGWDIVLDVRGR